MSEADISVKLIGNCINTEQCYCDSVFVMLQMCD